MDLNTIVEKRKFYSDMIRSLENKDIEAEVELKLQAQKDKIRAEIVAETNADINKCNNYVAVLDELIAEATEIRCEESSEDSIMSSEDSTEEMSEIPETVNFIGG